MSEAQLRFMEDRAVDECIAIQERAGVSVITDGEMWIAMSCGRPSAVPVIRG